MASLTFVTGPVCSGKSRFAERLSAAVAFSVVTCIATGRIRDGDGDWGERTEEQVARRPASWRFVETARPGAPSLEALLAVAGERETMLIDSFPEWLVSQARPDDVRALEAKSEEFLAALASTRAYALIVVGEEFGWGVTPADPERRLRDVIASVQARLATQAERSYLVVSGFALDLRAQGRPIGP